MTNSQTIAITGGSGSLGTFLKSIEKTNKHCFYQLERSSLNNSWNDSFETLLESINDCKLLIHAANPKAPRTKDDIYQFLSNSSELIDKCKAENIKVIFISSLNNHSRNYSEYAKYKSFLEKEVLNIGGYVVRLGHFDSEDNGSSFAKMNDLIDRHFLLRALLYMCKSKFYISKKEDIHDFFNLLLESPNRFEKDPIQNLFSVGPLVMKIGLKPSIISLDNGTKEIRRGIAMDFVLKALSRAHNGMIDALINLCCGQDARNSQD